MLCLQKFVWVSLTQKTGTVHKASASAHSHAFSCAFGVGVTGGTLAREGSRDRIVISISLLMRSVMVELDRSAVESIAACVIV